MFAGVLLTGFQINPFFQETDQILLFGTLALLLFFPLDSRSTYQSGGQIHRSREPKGRRRVVSKWRRDESNGKGEFLEEPVWGGFSFPAEAITVSSHPKQIMKAWRKESMEHRVRRSLRNFSEEASSHRKSREAFLTKRQEIS